MKTYLLLRNNRQSGPYTLSELLEEGLRAQDLVWVEGFSASWRYPAELDELKAYVPPPLLETPQDLGFVEVQNRVVPHRSGIASLTTEVEEPSSLRISHASDALRTEIIPSELPSINPSIPIKESHVPAFNAINYLLPDDDQIPTMAWQSATIGNTGETIPARPDTIADAKQDIPPVVVPSDTGPSKVKVMLPTAVADKTMVVIQRRDPGGQDRTNRGGRSRRPVLEFIPEEDDTSTADMPVDVPMHPELDSGSSADQVQAELTAVHDSGRHAVSEKDNSVSPENVVNMSREIRAHLIDVPASGLQTEKVGVAAVGTLVANEEAAPTHHAYPAPSKATNIQLLQKIAIFIAIVSLLALAILMVNSIFNPNAYQY